MRTPIRASVLLAAVAALPGALPAQELGPLRAAFFDRLPVGQVVERVVSRTDSTTSWALYLPTAYDPERSWPVLFLMDPRGRALVPLERVIPAAERYGYVVLSSYDTASDFLWRDPNDRAVGAMLDDAQRLVRVDPRRLYLVGFSGTTRAAWSLGMRLPGNVAGVIGSGGGLPPTLYRPGPNPLRHVDGLAFYGFAGAVDYSHEEMVRVRTVLTRYGVPNRLDFFPGPHGWPPSEDLTRAVEWMEIRAMATGLRSVDVALADSLFRARVRRMETLEAEGRMLEAWREASDAAALFEGMVEVAPVRGYADALATRMEVREALAREQATGQRFFALVDALETALFDIQVGGRPPDARRIVDELDIDGIRGVFEASTDPEEVDAAQRLLEHVFVHTSFYQARAYLVQGRPDHALAMLEVAERAFPDRPRVRLLRAQALALAGRDREALGQVRLALAAGYGADAIRADEELASLWKLRGFDALVGGRRAQPEGPR